MWCVRDLSFVFCALRSLTLVRSVQESTEALIAEGGVPEGLDFGLARDAADASSAAFDAAARAQRMAQLFLAGEVVPESLSDYVVH